VKHEDVARTVEATCILVEEKMRRLVLSTLEAVIQNLETKHDCDSKEMVAM
jgi:hypothetical protein